MGTNPPPLPAQPGSLRSNDGVCCLLALVKERLCRAARRLLHPRLRSLFDPDDIVQDVLCALCARRDEITDRATADSAVAYLLGMVRHRAQQLNRRFLDFPSRDVRRETGLTAATRQVDPHPSAQLLVEHADLWGHFLTGLSDLGREVLARQCAGQSTMTMARSMNLPEWSVRKAREALLDALRTLAEALTAPLHHAEC